RDEGVLGRRLTLDRLDVTVVGVTPRDFTGTFPSVPDIWMPLAIRLGMDSKADIFHDRGSLCCRLYGRLANHVTKSAADAEVNALAVRYQMTFLGPDSWPPTVRRMHLVEASPLGANDSGAPATIAAILLLGAIGLVLLIACANVASL